MIVGKSPSPSKSFTLHTSVFADNSSFLALEPFAIDQPRQICLDNENPNDFESYVNYVYFGLDVVEQWIETSGHATPPHETDDQRQEAADTLFERQISLYLLAKRLKDYKTANTVVDEIVRFNFTTSRIPAQPPISLAFTSTDKDEPLRSLLKDLWIYDAGDADIERLRTLEFPHDFVHGVAIGLLEVKNLPPDLRDDYQSVSSNCDEDACCYHSHDEKHPRCNPRRPGEHRKC